MTEILEWSQLTGKAIDALDRKKTVVLVSCSPLEVHGPHLPTMADLREAQGLLDRSAELLGAKDDGLKFLRLPWMWVAADVLPHRGSIKFSPSTVRTVVAEMGESLGRQGFRHVWVGNFHGGPRHILAVERGCDDAYRRQGVFMISVFSLLVKRLTGGSSDLATLLGGIGGITREQLKGDSHGGLVETAMLLHLVGEHVDPSYRDLPPRSLEIERAEQAKPPMQRGDKATILEILRSFPLKQQYFERETYAGSPALANAEVGAQYLEKLATEAADALGQVLAGRVAYKDCHSPLWPMRHVLLSDRIGRAFDALFAAKESPV